MPTRKLEVCFTTALYEQKSIAHNFATVVVDILRATTSMCVAFYYGVKEIIPVADMKAASLLQEKGFLLAAEEDGVKPQFADFGNSPFDFQTDKLTDQILVFKTTNGTGAILQARDADEILLGAYLNLSVLADYLKKSDKNVVILCSGWKGQFCFEDTVFAGALTERLLSDANFQPEGDGTLVAQMLWKESKDDLKMKMKLAAHAKRLKKLKLDDTHDYTFTPDSAVVLPAFKNNKLLDLLRDKV